MKSCESVDENDFDSMVAKTRGNFLILIKTSIPSVFLSQSALMSQSHNHAMKALKCLNDVRLQIVS